MLVKLIISLTSLQVRVQTQLLESCAFLALFLQQKHSSSSEMCVKCINKLNMPIFKFRLGVVGIPLLKGAKKQPNMKVVLSMFLNNSCA